MKSIHVDFNNISRGRIKGSLRHASDRQFEIGEAVHTYDAEGNTCNAFVSEIKGEIVALDLHLESWNDPR